MCNMVVVSHLTQRDVFCQTKLRNYANTTTLIAAKYSQITRNALFDECNRTSPLGAIFCPNVG